MLYQLFCGLKKKRKQGIYTFNAESIGYFQELDELFQIEIELLITIMFILMPDIPDSYHSSHPEIQLSKGTTLG